MANAKENCDDSGLKFKSLHKIEIEKKKMRIKAVGQVARAIYLKRKSGYKKRPIKSISNNLHNEISQCNIDMGMYLAIAKCRDLFS